MEKQLVNITRKELDGFMRELESLKSTIEILQDREAMGQISESERLEKKKAELLDIELKDVCDKNTQ